MKGQKMAKDKNDPQDEMVRLQQQMAAREVDEELQREKMRAFWEKYRYVILGIIIGVLCITIGMELYQTWKTKTSLEESDAFENAVILSYTGEQTKALEALDELSQNAHSGYQHLADMKIAGILFSQNKDAQALKVLKKVMDSSAPKQLKAVATISYVGNQVDTGDIKELQNLLEPMIKKPYGFAGSAAELSAVLYLREGNKDAAVKVLQDAVNSNLTSPVVKERLKELIVVIEK